MKKDLFEKLLAKGWKDPQKVLPDIVKGTEDALVNEGKTHPVQERAWLESEPVLVIIDEDEFRPELLRMSRLTVCRTRYSDDDSGVLLEEITEAPEWFIGPVGYEPEYLEYCNNEKILVWRPLDNLLPDLLVNTSERDTGSYRWSEK